MNSLAEKLTARQSELKFNARPLLSKHQARRLKRFMIRRYCEDRLSAAAVARAFEVFPELKGA
jgi:hypothetical protein